MYSCTLWSVAPHSPVGELIQPQPHKTTQGQASEHGFAPRCFSCMTLCTSTSHTTLLSTALLPRLQHHVPLPSYSMIDTAVAATAATAAIATAAATAAAATAAWRRAWRGSHGWLPVVLGHLQATVWQQYGHACAYGLPLPLKLPVPSSGSLPRCSPANKQNESVRL